MIVPMKHLDLICIAAERTTTVEKLRDLGVIHLDLNRADSQSVSAARGEIAEAEKAVLLIGKARGRQKRDELDIHERSVKDVLALDADRATLLAEQDRLERLVRQYEPYGDFDPALAQRLLDRGIDLSSVAKLPAKLPEMRLSRLQEKLARVRNRAAIDTAKIAGTDEEAILRGYPALADRMAFEQAKELLSVQGQVAVISGWIPEPQVPTLMREVSYAYDTELFQAVKKPGWGVLLRDPEPGETPPTLVEPPRVFRPMKALFDGLGIAPAYTEADVSVPFMCYFALFFAMLVGDGAYGAIFLGATLAMRRKLPKSWFVLLTVFSAATIAWGLLSNTWFGAGFPFAKSWPTVDWLSGASAPAGHEYDNMMLLCFTVGVSHLMLARLWNGLCLLNDSTCVAQFGWAGVLLFMYLVTNSIVGIFPGIPTWGYWVFGVSLVAVFGFSVKPSELKTRGAELGMLPLSIMSALGDIISYVRLFAVGLASVKVAENFNAMATGLVSSENAWWLNALFAVAMVAILVVGHALNLAMAGLSILVHAVRLNTLEFSNHKGVSWAGYAFRAFGAKR